MERLKYFLILLFLAIIILIQACDEKIFTIDVDCNECYTEKPDSVDLIIHWTKNSEFNEIPALLFKGSADGGELIDTFYLFGNPAYIWVKAGEEYSMQAIYENSSRTVMVIDGTKQKVKKVSDYCDTECWIVEDEQLQLKLRY